MSFLLKGKAAISSMDYKEMVSDIKNTDLVYMDPPYQGICGDSRYCSGIDHNEFVNFFSDLNKKNTVSHQSLMNLFTFPNLS